MNKVEGKASVTIFTDKNNCGYRCIYLADSAYCNLYRCHLAIAEKFTSLTERCPKCINDFGLNQEK